MSISALISIVILIFSYMVANSAYPMAGEYAALKSIYDFKKFFGQQLDNVPDSILFINVSHDKQLIPYEEEGMPVGNIPITDREKLLQFLTIAKEADNYRYIFMDILFDEGFETSVDSSLFQTINSMKSILIPTHQDIKLKDTILYNKAANADYLVTWKQTSFAHYQFLHHDSIPSVALKMYADLKHCDGYGIEPHWGGLWYTDNGNLCQNGTTLFLNVRLKGSQRDEEGQMRKRNYIYLGTDLLDLDSIVPVKDQIRDKIVIIGDFKNDTHSTYVGSQPGSALCLNAYLMLINGKHLVNWMHVLIMFIIYTIVGSFYLRGSSFQSLFTSPWLGVLMSFLSTATLFLVIAIIAYWNDVAFNMWVPTTIYSFIDTYVQKRNIYNKKKNEKITFTSASKPVAS
jgi:hypothetical protein